MDIKGIIPSQPQAAAQLSPDRQKQEKELQQACRQFETIFLSQLMTQMRQSIPKNDIFGDGKEKEIYQDMLGQEQAKNWAESGGIGLANLLYQQLRTPQ